MKTNLFLKTSLMAIFCIALTATSCSDDETLVDNESEEAEMAELTSIGENESDDVLEVLDQVEISADGSEAGRVNALCATVTNDTENKILTVDFGEGCVGPYGRTRSGKILIAYSGVVNDGISNRIITFENYVVNNRAVTGSIAVPKLIAVDPCLMICSLKALGSLLMLNGRGVAIDPPPKRDTKLMWRKFRYPKP